MIRISRVAEEAIREHGRSAYPEECCGALLGEKRGGEDRVLRAEPAENVRKDRRQRRFRIAPEEYLRLERLAGAEGCALLGFYHSHPDHPAVPSEYDREHALPFFHYVVLGVASGEPGQMASWVLSEDRRVFDREELQPAEAGD
ncbi:MAG: Mov34/MPN/PAD-1 family protein [Thermoanaerobaculia bacterium]